MCGQLIFDKETKNTAYEKGSFFNKLDWKAGYSHQKNEIGPLSYTTHKNKLKMD